MVGLLSKPRGLLAKRSGDSVPLILDSLKRALKNRAQAFFSKSANFGPEIHTNNPASC